MRPPGDEDEVARRGGGGDQAVPLIVHEQPAIETFAHVDAAPGVGPAVGTAGIWTHRGPSRTVLSRATMRV